MRRPARFKWTHIFRSLAYHRARANERLLIEIRFSLAVTLRARRRSLKLTQAALAKKMGATPATLSRIERAKNGVAMDVFVRAMIVMGANTAEIAAAFDADSRQDVQRLRLRTGPRTRRP